LLDLGVSGGQMAAWKLPVGDAHQNSGKRAGTQGARGSAETKEKIGTILLRGRSAVKAGGSLTILYGLYVYDSTVHYSFTLRLPNLKKKKNNNG
jgi:hypothetical protein